MLTRIIHSENGPIANAREVQSEYWRLKNYSLFISIWAHLLNSAWVDRVGALSKGDAVTVELEGESILNSITPPVGSCYAEVVASSNTHYQ